jgi:hypothetical protein
MAEPIRLHERAKIGNPRSAELPQLSTLNEGQGKRM